jgi:hypothetical protein
VSQPTPLKQNLIPRFDNRIEATPSNEARLQRWKIYSLTFLYSKNSDGAKDTWDSPHYIDTVHEEAGDEYVHGKLKEDKLRQRCRDTSLQASNGGTRTSPQTEAWSAMQIEVFLSVFFELLLEVADEVNETVCSASGQSNGRDGLAAGWPKTSRRGKQEWRRCRARKQRDLEMATPRKGFPFYSSMERNDHPN